MDADEVIEEWGVFNDPAYFEPRFADGQLHGLLREQLLETPLFQAPLPGPAKRFAEWTNRERFERGGPDRIAQDGLVVVRTRTITKTAWRTISGVEYEQIDDGRRPNG